MNLLGLARGATGELSLRLYKIAGSGESIGFTAFDGEGERQLIFWIAIYPKRRDVLHFHAENVDPIGAQKLKEGFLVPDEMRNIWQWDIAVGGEFLRLDEHRQLRYLRDAINDRVQMARTVRRTRNPTPSTTAQSDDPRPRASGKSSSTGRR
jgi:hypothetical protein